jgi:hypothetical protein
LRRPPDLRGDSVRPPVGRAARAADAEQRKPAALKRTSGELAGELAAAPLDPKPASVAAALDEAVRVLDEDIDRTKAVLGGGVVRSADKGDVVAATRRSTWAML